MIDRTEAGRRLRAAREAIGLTQTEAARRLGILQPDMARLEGGDRIPSWIRVIDIVATLGLDPRIIAPEFFPERE